MNTFHVATIFVYDLRRVRSTTLPRSSSSSKRLFYTSSLKVRPRSMRTKWVASVDVWKRLFFLCTLSKCRISEKWHYYFSYNRFQVRYFIFYTLSRRFTYFFLALKTYSITVFRKNVFTNDIIVKFLCNRHVSRDKKKYWSFEIIVLDRFLYNNYYYIYLVI